VGKQLTHDDSRAQHCADILKAVAHPVRLRIVALLCQGPQHVSGICEQLELPQAIVSQQLRILRMRDLVQVTRSEGFAYYALKEMRLTDLVHCVEGCSVPAR
jgi:DNA-binding transcriptional ArsR family regulator